MKRARALHKTDQSPRCGAAAAGLQPQPSAFGGKVNGNEKEHAYEQWYEAGMACQRQRQASSK